MICTNLRKNIIDIINQSGLPIDGTYYVLKDILNEVADVMNRQLQEEQKAAAQEKLSEVKEEDSAANNQEIEKEEE